MSRVCRWLLLAFGVALSTPGVAAGRGEQAAKALAAAEAAQRAEAFAVQARYLTREGLAFEHGEGVPRELSRAVALYCEAARLGDPEAMYALGWMYTNARGVERNDDYAGTLFAMAAFLGHEQAEKMLRYTNPYTGEVPACIHPPPEIQSWPAEELLGAMSGDRRLIARKLVELAPTYSIEPRLALAIALAESNLDPAARSEKNAIGVMQLIPKTAARFNVRQPLDPEQNIRGGLTYLRWLLAYFEGDIALAAAAYNAGEKSVERYGGVPPFPETQQYVKRILAFVGNQHHHYDSRITAPSMVMAAKKAR